MKVSVKRAPSGEIEWYRGALRLRLYAETEPLFVSWGDFMELPKRKHPRLDNFDYSSCGAYFLTLCAKDKKCIFSRITVGRDDLGAPETSRFTVRLSARNYAQPRRGAHRAPATLRLRQL